MADDYAALFASVIIIINAYKLLKPSIYELMDANLSTDFIDELKKEAETVNEVVEVEKFFVRKMGFDYYVDAHVIVNGDLTVSEGHNIAHKVKEHLIAFNSMITEVMVHIEPDREKWTI